MNMFLVLFYLVFFVKSIISAPPSVSIGAIFTLFDEDNSVNAANSQYLAAFMMAINEINNKTDGIADNLLPNTILKFAVRTSLPTDTSAAEAAVDLSSKTTIDGQIIPAVVASLSGSAAQTSCAVFSSSSTLDLLSVSMETKQRQDDVLGEKYSLRTVPIDAFQGFVWQSLLCQYNYTSISIFYLKNAFGSAAIDLLMNKRVCNINTLSSHAIDENQNDFSADIVRALTSQSTVFVIFLDAPTAAMLLQQGYAYGLFRVGRQIILNQELVSSNLFSYFAPSAELTNIMRGVLAVRYWPDYSVQYTQQGVDFRRRLTSQANTISSNSCDASVDDSDEGGHYLYRHEDYDDDSSLCAGLNFSSFVTADDFDPYISQTYDAVYAFAYGMHHLLHHKNKSRINGDKLRLAIYENVSFVGASGYVRLLNDNAGHCSASRAVGIHYRVLNFRVSEYLAGRDPYTWIGTWSDASKYSRCDRSLPTCFKPKFNTLDEKLPSHLPPYVKATLPSVLKIGGLFNPYTEYGQARSNGIQHLAAFLMAINEINNKSDGVHDDILPNTQIVVSVRSPFGLLHGQLMAQSLVAEDFGGTGVQAIVSASGDYEVIGANQIFYTANHLQIQSVANHFTNNNQVISPQKLQMSESATYPGTVLQNIICSYYNYRKVTIFYANDFLGLHLYYEFLSKQFCEFNVLSSHAIIYDQTDFKSEISEAKAAGARIFIFLLDYRTTATLLEAGHKTGLFGPGRQIFSNQDGVSVKLWQEATSANANVPALLRGVIGIRYLPNYSIDATAEGRAFVERWRKQPNTLGGMVDSSFQCDRSRDDNDGYSLYSTRLVGFPGSETCLGLNFSAFAEDGSDIAINTTQTYDSTMAILRGIHRMVHTYGMTDISGSVLHYTMVNDIEFQGVSGYVDFSEGMTGTNYYGRGDRASGLYYELVNFSEERYRNTSGAEAFVRIGLWEMNAGYQPCVTDASLDEHARRPVDTMIAGCHRPMYNSNNQYVPVSETPSPKIITLSAATRGIMITFGAVIFLITLMFTRFAHKHRHKALMQTAQPRILYVLFIGGYLASGRVVVAALPISDGTCISAFWMAHLGFALVLGALWAKIWRVHRIVSNRNFKKKKFRLTQVGVLKILGFVISLFIIYMVIVTVYGKPHASYVERTRYNRQTRYPVCTYEKGVYFSFMYLIELVAIVYSVWLCWQFKAVSDNNESKCSIMGVFVIATVFSLVLPMLYFVNFQPNIEIIILTFAIGFVALVCVASQYSNKILILREREEYNFALENETSYSHIRLDKKFPVLHASNMFSGMTKDKKITLCRQQIVCWTEMLMRMLHQSAANDESSASDNLSRSNHCIVPIDEESEEDVTDLIMTRGKSSHLARVDVRLSEGMSSMEELKNG